MANTADSNVSSLVSDIYVDFRQKGGTLPERVSKPRNYRRRKTTTPVEQKPVFTAPPIPSLQPQGFPGRAVDPEKGNNKPLLNHEQVCFASDHRSEVDAFYGKTKIKPQYKVHDCFWDGTQWWVSVFITNQKATPFPATWLQSLNRIH